MTKPTIRVPANLPGPAFTADGFANFVTRIGTNADKASGGHYAMTWFMAQFDLDAAYRTSWLRKIVDIPPFDEVREWRTWAGADAEQVELLDDEEKRLDIRRKVAEARTLARKDGGAVLLLGLDGNPSMPAMPEMVRQGGLRYVTVLNRNEITPQKRQDDPTKPGYGEPTSYTVSVANRGAVEIHPSRIIRFIGNPVRSLTGEWDGWGEPIWVELRDAVRHSDQIAAAVANLVDEAKLDVFRIKGMMNGLATAEYEALLLRRWNAMNIAKSSVNAVLLDSEDEYDQKVLGFAGLPDIQDRALMIMSGMADIPATRLLGRSPQGMNATGDSDIRNYYDRIRAGQHVMLQPTIRPLDECLIMSALGSRPDGIYYEWNPLYQMSEQEAATIEKTFSDAAKVYADAALVPDTALAGMVKDGIIERGQWPGAQQAFDDADAEGELPGLLEEPSEAEKAAEAAMIAGQVAKPAGGANGAIRLVASNDAKPRTLYVSRKLLNGANLVKWAKSQGFASTLDASDMHVTIAFSRTPVDWMEMGDTWQAKMEVPEGGARLVEPLGDKGAVVLLFSSSELKWRNEAMRERGASWDWPDYQPHVTISYKGAGIDLSKVEPYQGKLVFGPEIFAEVVEDWEKDK